MTKLIPALIADLLAQARQNNHRRCLVIAGSRPWAEASLQTSLTVVPEKSIYRATSDEKLLGKETSTVIFDAFDGFNPDIFGAIAGTLRGGGLFILLTPPLADWPTFNDPEYQRITVYPVPAAHMTGRFLQRIVGVLQSHEQTILLEENKKLSGVIPTEYSSPTACKEADFIHPIFRTEDQQLAVEAIKKVVTGHRRRPLVITSDRGRGKSAALGIAAAQLMQEGVDHILVTAPSLAAVKIIFLHAESCLENTTVSRGLLKTETGTLEFLPPDDLIRHEQKTGLLLVDEAAAIPAPLLTQLLDRYSRIAYATTIHGYEGTGRGFAIRFNHALNTKTPNWKTLQLEEPIRWAANDPLEDLVFKTLLLDAQPAEDNALINIRKENCSLELLDRQQLLKDENTLCQLFGLLINAHYQTRPSDLRYLLDGPNLSVFVMRDQENIIATALIAREGGFNKTMAQEITTGKRRPHGHLIPETLASHMGLEQAPLLHSARIVRIAVHPTVQKQGWGSALLEQLKKHPALSDLDYLAACFGANTELLQFWKKSDYLPVRMGLQRNASSGEHSVVVIHPLSQQGDDLFKIARERFFTHLPHQLSDSLKDLEPGLIAWLMQTTEDFDADLNMMDWKDLHAFTQGQRGYESCPAPIWKFTCVALISPKAIKCLDNTQLKVLISKVLQKQSWQEVSHSAGLSGKKAAENTLQGALSQLIQLFEK